MCYLIHHVHAECGHQKKIETIEFCSAFDQGTCAAVPISFQQITAPSLCVSCFRQKEAGIDAEYHGRVETNRRRIAEYEATLADMQVRGRARASHDDYIAELELNTVAAKRYRDVKIQIFRHEQGVWGDG